MQRFDHAHAFWLAGVEYSSSPASQVECLFKLAARAFARVWPQQAILAPLG